MATSTSSNLRLPDQLRINGGDVADNWQRFREQFENYVVAADLSESSSEKRAAVFLSCIGGEAFDVFRTMQFESADDKKKIEKLLEAFESFCIGTVNVTYERYTFHRRMQDTGERFEVFLGDVRRLARSCQFEGVEESMIRDRIVVGIRDDATRRKLLQVRDLKLKDAIDICRASEAAGRQLKAMTSPEELQPLQTTPRGRHRSVSRRRKQNRDQSVGGPCRYCGRQHGGPKENCAAFGQKCRKCSKMNHFEKMCRSAANSTTKQLCQVK